MVTTTDIEVAGLHKKEGLGVARFGAIVVTTPLLLTILKEPGARELDSTNTGTANLMDKLVASDRPMLRIFNPIWAPTCPQLSVILFLIVEKTNSGILVDGLIRMLAITLSYRQTSGPQPQPTRNCEDRRCCGVPQSVTMIFSVKQTDSPKSSHSSWFPTLVNTGDGKFA